MTISRCVKDGQTVLGVITGGGGVRFRNLVLGIIGVPQQLPALAAPEEFRLGNVGPLRRGGGSQNGAAYVASCNSRCAEIEHEDTTQLVAAPVDNVEAFAPDFNPTFDEHFADLLGGSWIVGGEIK